LTCWPFKKFFTPQRIKDAEDFFHKWGTWTIFAAGFVAGVRACTYFLAASMGVKYRRFIAMDFARAALTCPISIWAGWKWGPDAEKIIHQYTLPLIVVIALAALFFVGRWYIRRKNQPPTPAPEAAKSE
jgi:membrane-associated protein